MPAVVIDSAVFLAIVGVLGAAALRSRLGKDAHLARRLLVPGLALIVLSAALGAALDDAAAAMPPASAGLLLAAGGWCFQPTRHTRFAAFERGFWAHVAHRGEFSD